MATTAKTTLRRTTTDNPAKNTQQDSHDLTKDAKIGKKTDEAEVAKPGDVVVSRVEAAAFDAFDDVFCDLATEILAKVRVRAGSLGMPEAAKLFEGFDDLSEKIVEARFADVKAKLDMDVYDKSAEEFGPYWGGMAEVDVANMVKQMARDSAALFPNFDLHELVEDCIGKYRHWYTDEEKGKRLAEWDTNENGDVVFLWSDAKQERVQTKVRVEMKEELKAAHAQIKALEEMLAQEKAKKNNEPDLARKKSKM